MDAEKRGVQRWVLLCGMCLAVLMVHAQTSDNPPDTTRDTLVYKDGDRIHGHLVQQTGGIILFRSERFGLLRVAESDAVIIKAEKPAKVVEKEVVAQGLKPSTPAETRKEAEKVSLWDRYSPAVLTAKVRDFFGPWHGRAAFSNEIVSDTAKRDNLALEGKLTRKFTKDAVELDARYDYDQTNGATTTDMAKAIGSWRHDFNSRYFSQYRPTFEWNRASLRDGVPNEYELLQQEFGLGVNIVGTPSQTVRVGVSENLFDVWNSAPFPDHSSRGVESMFDETVLLLPWRMTLSQRGVWYPESTRSNGYEDQIELSKKLTETFSIAVRHEIRRNNPDGASQDYTRLRLLFGLDF